MIENSSLQSSYTDHCSAYRPSLCCRSGLEYQGYYNATKAKQSYRFEYTCLLTCTLYAGCNVYCEFVFYITDLDIKVYIVHSIAPLCIGILQVYQKAACMCMFTVSWYLLCRWFCHFDDDIYVNTAQLLRLLKKYDPMKEKMYLGHFPANLWKDKKKFQKKTKKIEVSGS